MAFENSRWILLADIDLGAESADSLRLAVTLPSAVVGVAYTGQLTASGGLEPYLYDDSPAGTVPPGLSIDDTTGAITGTPTTVGYYEFTASVTDANTDTASQVVSIRVTSGIAFAGNFPAGEVGIAYSAGLSASGGTAPYTWSIASGTVPTGTGPIDSSTGLIAGTPSVAGTFNFTVRATDSLGNPQDFPTSITIASALDITTSNYADGFIGVFYNAGPTVIGGVAPISYAVSSGAIPAGTNFSPSTGFVTGTPTTAATYAFDITGTDALGGTSTTSQSVVIAPGGGGGGGITSFASHDLSPLFTQTVTDPTGPAVDLAFTQIAQAINLVFAGPASGGSAAPTFRALVTNDLPSTAVTPGTYGDSTHVARVTFDSKGRATSASSVAIAAPISDSGALLVFPDGNLSSGFGTINLTREAYYNNVTFSATDVINTNGFSLNINNADMTNAGAGAIRWDAGSGGNGAIGAGSPPGAAGTAGTTAGMCGNGFAGAIGATGSSGNGVAGATGGLATPTFNGGLAGASGAGGISPTRTGGASTAAGGAGGGYQPMGRVSPLLQVLTNLVSPATIKGGNGGPGGASGGGSSVTGSPGGSGGGGGAGGNVVQVRINTLTRGASTAAGAIRAIGGNGGTGGQGGVAGDLGGGGGGGAGGGGWVYLVVRTLAGSTATNMISSAGGNGGNGGNRLNAGTAGNGGTGGVGGRITYMYLDGNTGTEVTGSSGSAGTAGSGGTPGTGGAGGVCNMSI